MKIHLTAVGGSIMHNLALALHAQGHEVTGSDDIIYDPARTRLAEAGLLPSGEGWNPERIHSELDAVILGMHAKANNPELARAQALNLPIYSFPEFIFQLSQQKQRVVIAGSHGKTSITSLILHVLNTYKFNTDFLVGAQLEGFERMVKITEGAPVIVLEGDEYLTSALDKRPKFLLYKPHTIVLSGIAWDHINAFETEEIYLQQFISLLKIIPKAGVIIYNIEDEKVKAIVEKYSNPEVHYLIPYATPTYRIQNGSYELKLEGRKFKTNLIGKHNMGNIAAAWEVCKQFAISIEAFTDAIEQFEGAAKRLQKVYEDEKYILYRDFAHSPSKVRATVDAVLERYKQQKVIVCFEMHTYSSLNKAFIHQYKDCLKKAKHKLIYIDEATLKHKNYPNISREELVAAFNDEEIVYVKSAGALNEKLSEYRKGERQTVFLMMSSGNFGGINLQELILGEKV